MVDVKDQKEEEVTISQHYYVTVHKQEASIHVECFEIELQLFKSSHWNAKNKL